AVEQQLIVVGVGMADGGDHGERNGLLVELPGGGGATDPPAGAQAGVLGDGAGFGRGASGVEVADAAGKRVDVRLIELGVALVATFALQGAGCGIVEALGFGAGDGGLFGKNALAFVTLAGATPLHYDGAQFGVFGSTARE